MRKGLTILFLLFAAVSANAQTTAITGTFKTPGGLTPTAAGIASVATVNGTPVYGRADFDPFDVSGNAATRMVCNGVTYLPQTVHGWIRGDGVLMDSGAVNTSVSLIPTIPCQPANLMYRAIYSLNGKADGSVRAVTWTEFKQVPQMTLVDWTSLSPALVSKAAFSYVTQNGGTVLDYLDFSQISTPPLPTSTTVCRAYFDVATGRLKGETSAGLDCNPSSGSGGSAFSINLLNPTSGDSGLVQWKPASIVSLSRISCDVDTGSATINFELRTEISPNVAGTQVLTVPLTCGVTTASSSSFSNFTVPARTPVALTISSTAGSPTVVRVHAEY
jgi:hypothetical protein